MINDEKIASYYTENPGSDPLDVAVELGLLYWDLIFALDRLMESGRLVLVDGRICPIRLEAACSV